MPTRAPLPTSLLPLLLAASSCAVGNSTVTMNGLTPDDAGVDVASDLGRDDVAADASTGQDVTRAPDVTATPDDTSPADVVTVTDVPTSADAPSSTDGSASTDASPLADGSPDARADVATCGAEWPSCGLMPDGATPSTIAAIWAANPTRPELRWVSNVVVTAVSRGACSAGVACQIYVQEPTGATTLEGAAHHAIKVFISAASASRFTGIRLGDRVDIAASAWRYNLSGQNELLLQVADSCALRGCMLRTGDGAIDPVPATLDALGSVAAYESTVGPVLVRLSGVAATTDATTPLTSTTGGLFVPGVSLDGGRAEPVSVSPFFLTGSRFEGYTASQRLRFTTLVGVFGMFIPSTALADGGVAKYLQVYPRTAADITLMM